MSTNPADGNREEEILLALIEPFPERMQPDAVQRYTEMFRAGMVLPLIDVSEIPHHRYRYRISDGRHRATAARAAGCKTIRARILFDEYGFAEWQREQIILEKRRRLRNRLLRQ